MPKVYLAGPYSSPEPEIRENRYRTLTTIAGALLERRITVYSPITEGHAIIRDGRANLSGDWNYWQEHDTEMIGYCRVFVQCMLSGHEHSIGLAAELKIAAANNMPVVTYRPGGSFEKLADDVRAALAS
jgi:hypothetical protein